MPKKKCRKICDASGKNGMPSCCKCVFELIGDGRANLAHIQPVYLKCPKMRFWQKNVSSQMGQLLSLLSHLNIIWTVIMTIRAPVVTFGPLKLILTSTISLFFFHDQSICSLLLDRYSPLFHCFFVILSFLNSILSFHSFCHSFFQWFFCLFFCSFFRSFSLLHSFFHSFSHSFFHSYFIHRYFLLDIWLWDISTNS